LIKTEIFWTDSTFALTRKSGYNKNMHQLVQLYEGIFSQACVLQYRVKHTFNCSHLQPSLEDTHQQNRQH